MTVGTKDEVQPTITQMSLEKGSVDDAWSFLNKTHDGNEDATTVDINALRRKIDWRIVPIMFGCYTMQFLDKVILNVSRSQQDHEIFHIDSLPVRSCHGDPEGPASCRERLLEYSNVPLRGAALL